MAADSLCRPEMNDQPQQPRRAVAFGVFTLFMCLLGWSTVPLFLRHLSEWIDPWTNNGWRYGASALFWLPVVAAGYFRGTLARGIWRAAIWPSVANALGQAAFTAAYSCAQPGLVTFGLRSQLIFVAVGAYLMFPQERAVIRSKRYLIGLGLLVAGLIPMLTTGSEAWNGTRLLGVVLSVLSGLGYGWYALSVRACMAKFRAVESFAVICQFTAVLLIVGMLMFGKNMGADVPSLPERELWFLFFSALIGIALGHVFYYIAIARIGVAVTSGVLQLQPVLVAIASARIFGEVLTLPQWIGGAVAIGGAATMLLPAKRARP